MIVLWYLRVALVESIEAVFETGSQSAAGYSARKVDRGSSVSDVWLLIATHPEVDRLALIMLIVLDSISERIIFFQAWISLISAPLRLSSRTISFHFGSVNECIKSAMISSIC